MSDTPQITFSLFVLSLSASAEIHLGQLPPPGSDAPAAPNLKEAAHLITASLEKAIGDKVVTYDFARLMQGAKQVSCSGFGQAMIERM